MAKSDLTRLSENERADYESFMAAVRGMPAHQVAFAFNSLTPGTDWRRCSKGYIAYEWARRASIYSNGRLKHVTIERITAAADSIRQRY